MQKFELSISKDYVPGWGVVDAVRELFQNALDQELQQEDNPMFFNYDEATQTLSIGNKASVLSTASLLFGSSTKRNDKNTVGQFGEGYKLAALVLTRKGKALTFYNYGASEVWKPRFVNSKRYQTEILTFFVDKKFGWQKIPDNDLTITVEGITPEEYEKIIESNLHLQKPHKTISTPYGFILLEDKHKGKVFVNGLYVCSYAEYHYGYNFKPEDLRLDRDRKLADTFDLKWLASKMWMNTDTEEHTQLAAELVRQQAADVAFVTSAVHSVNKVKDVATAVYDNFRTKNGFQARPATSTYEVEKIKAAGYTPVIVPQSVKEVIEKSPSYAEVRAPEKPRYSTRLEAVLTQNAENIVDGVYKQLMAIIDEMKQELL